MDFFTVCHAYVIERLVSEIESLMTESLATYRLRPSNRKRFRNSLNLIGVGSGGVGWGNTPPTFSFNFYVKQENITNVPS